MKNFVQPGDSLPMIAPAGGVVSGRVYAFGNIVGVAAVTGRSGRTILATDRRRFRCRQSRRTSGRGRRNALPGRERRRGEYSGPVDGRCRKCEMRGRGRGCGRRCGRCSLPAGVRRSGIAGTLHHAREAGCVASSVQGPRLEILSGPVRAAEPGSRRPYNGECSAGAAIGNDAPSLSEDFRFREPYPSETVKR